MNRTSTPPFRVRNQELSLWQSVVAAYAIQDREQSENCIGKLNVTHVQDHPMVSGTNHLAAACVANDSLHSHLFIPKPHKHSTDDEIIAHFSSEFFHAARAIEGIPEKTLKELCKIWGEYYRKYSDKDYCGWAYCYEQYRKYKSQYHGIKKYNDWNPDKGLNFGVIDYKIPNNAKVAIIGDWGTGMQDAEQLLEIIFKNHQPDVIIHLGDIYYAGTPSECAANFFNIFEKMFTKYPRIPVFTIPGNHDYYSFAYGYYTMVENLNSEFSQQKNVNAIQAASYFCLRTEDLGWQFLGMDTGYGDSDPTNAFAPTVDGPFLHVNEPAWHKDKLDNFEGATILLSHHQVFSGNAKINGSDGMYGSYPYLNKNLLDFFRPYFGNKVAAWLWGHEHNQVKYRNNLFGLPVGRLIGASAYEELTSEDPYKQNFPEVPISSDSNTRLGNENGYYNHGFAMIDFSQRTHPTDPVTTQYYQYPSWGKTAPNPIPQKAAPMWHEPFKLQEKTQGNPLRFGQTIHLNLELGNAFIGPEKEHFVTTNEEYLPTVRTTPVLLKIVDSSNTSNIINDGDTVYILTKEKSVKGYNHLGAWEGIESPNVYYYKFSSSYQKNMRWKIKKVIPTPGNTVIHEHEAVYLLSEEFGLQYLCPYLPIINDVFSTYTYLGLSEKVNANWFIQVQSSEDMNPTAEEPDRNDHATTSILARIIVFIKSLLGISSSKK